MVKRKIGESFKIPYGCESDWENANTKGELGNHFLEMAIKYQEESIRARNSFWRKVRQMNDIPKTAHLEYYDIDHQMMRVVKSKDTPGINQRELESSLLQLEINRLRKKLKQESK